jgi:hypothetical protein
LETVKGLVGRKEVRLEKAYMHTTSSSILKLFNPPFFAKKLVAEAGLQKNGAKKNYWLSRLLAPPKVNP